MRKLWFDLRFDDYALSFKWDQNGYLEMYLVLLKCVDMYTSINSGFIIYLLFRIISIIQHTNNNSTLKYKSSLIP